MVTKWLATVSEPCLNVPTLCEIGFQQSMLFERRYKKMTIAKTRSKRVRLYETAIAALLTETTINKASAKCGISVSTMGRWMKEPAFQKLYNGASSAW